MDVYTTPEMLTTEEIQDLVGVEGVLASYEVLDSSNFSNPTIVMVCDDDALPKGFTPTCFTRNGDVVCGQVLILATNNSPQYLCLLNLTQAKIFKEELKLYEKPPKPEDEK